MRIRVSLVTISALSLIAVLLAGVVHGQVHRSNNEVVSAPTVAAAAPSAELSQQRKAEVNDAYGKLPLAFEKNVGQSDSDVQYLSHGNGYDLFLTPEEAVLALRAVTPLESVRNGRKTLNAGDVKRSILRMEFEGANRDAAISGNRRLPGKIDYFTGNDPRNWHTDVPSYARVEYRDLYPGVNAVFYGNQRRLEYDFVVAPGFDPSAIAFNLEGARGLRLETSGALAIVLSNGEVKFEKPVIYQNIGEERREVAGNYVVSGGNRITFDVGKFDPSRPLVIDPVLDYSTYLGGSAVGDFGSAIAVDGSGKAYIVGTTYSTSFPTVSNITSAGAGTTTSGAAFVTELNAAGTQELYSSYLSGDTGEFGGGVALDTLGNVYVCGQTFSTNYPTTLNGFSQTATPITNPSGTGFLSKINPAGSGAAALVYSTLLGGTNGDYALSVAADATGNAYVTGATFSGPGSAPTLFTLQNAYQTTLNSASGNAFLIRLDTTQSGSASLIYASYLGGSGSETGAGVAVDSSHNAYITGTTTSSNFPTTTNAFLETAPSGISNHGVFVSKINTAGSGSASLLYSSYIYGASLTGDFANGIALGPSNVAYITGETTSGFYVTTGAYSTVPSGADLAFVTLVDTSKSGSASVPYSATIGGSMGVDFGTGIRVDASGNAYVTGSAGSSNFPRTPGPLQSTQPSGTGNAFVLELNPGSHGATDLLYSSYFAGTTGQTYGASIALDTSKNAYITGFTSGTDFPVFATGGSAFQTSLTQTDGAATQAAFVSKLTLEPVLAFASPCAFNFTVTPTASCTLAFGNQLINTASTTQTITLTNNTSSTIAFTLPLTVSGANMADFAAAPAPAGGTAACSVTPLAAAASCAIGVTYTPSVSGAELATVTVNYTYNDGLSAPASGSQTVSVTGMGLAPTVVLNPATTLTFGSQAVSTTSAASSVTVSNTGNGNLTFTLSPAISGTNAGDFAIASGTTCTNGSSLVQTAPPTSPAPTCTINIAFTPTATGSRTATLTIRDNATNSPQTITITGTGVPATGVASVSPSTITFTGQLVTTTSAAQAVTVKNTGNGNLTISTAPSLSGAAAADFALASGTTCTSGAVVTPGSTCVINVTFTPPSGSSGSQAATLSIADSAAGSPQTISLTGTAWDFTVSAQSTTLNPGGTATIQVTVGSVGGFAGAVTLTCSGTIEDGTCTAPSTAVTPPATANVTITTQGFVAPSGFTRKPPVSLQQVLLGALALILLFTLPVARRSRTRLGLAGAAALLVIVAGCSGSLKTPAGTYPVTITGTSGTVSHAVTVNVVVN